MCLKTETSLTQVIWFQVFSLSVNNELRVGIYNLTQLISRFACLYLKESKCSKWQDGNFTNNLTLLILFTLFHVCWNLQMCWMYGCAFKAM